LNSFFDKNYKTPTWFARKQKHQSARRQFLKSAAGMAALSSFPVLSVSPTKKRLLDEARQQSDWQTLEAVQNHLLPASDSGPSAQEINAFEYLFNVVKEQPTDDGEITFIFKGVGWLNGHSENQLSKPFTALNTDEKERILKEVSQSRAGENWLNTLINYLFEAMLSPPAYGGNPNGIGWKWLQHQAGFPLPQAGDRYYELPPGTKYKSFEQKIAKQSIIPVNQYLNPKRALKS